MKVLTLAETWLKEPKPDNGEPEPQEIAEARDIITGFVRMVYEVINLCETFQNTEDPAEDEDAYELSKDIIRECNRVAPMVYGAPSPWKTIAEQPPPLDTYVLLWNGHWRGVGQAVALCDDESERWQDETTEYITPKPTHWMPLPDPPAAETAPMQKWSQTCRGCGAVEPWEAKDFFDAADKLPSGWNYDQVLKGPVCPKCKV